MFETMILGEDFRTKMQTGRATKAATSRRMKFVRLALELTQEQMAIVLGTSTSNYQHIERGQTFPQPPQVDRLLLNRGIDHHFIYHGDWSRVPVDILEKISEHPDL